MLKYEWWSLTSLLLKIKIYDACMPDFSLNTILNSVVGQKWEEYWKPQIIFIAVLVL